MTALDNDHDQNRVAFTIVLGILLLCLVEAIAYGATRFLTAKGAMSYIPDPTAEVVTEGLERSHPIVGWPADAYRPRPHPGFSEDSTCASTYGDSFTRGFGVSHTETYAHLLSERWSCLVANFGRRGYGTDQAFLVFRTAPSELKGDVVILGHWSGDIIRNLTRYLQFVIPSSHLMFKPRFTIAGDSLRLLSVPIRDRRGFALLRSNPDSVLGGDYFLDRPRPNFPNFLALLRYLSSDFHLHAALRGEPRYLAFYRRAHPSNAVELTARILADFSNHAKMEGRRPLVLLIPALEDFAHKRAKGEWPDGELAHALKKRAIPHLHLGPKLLEAIRPDDPCVLYLGGCESDARVEGRGHLTKRGHEMVARFVERHVGTTDRDASTASIEANGRGRAASQ